MTQLFLVNWSDVIGNSNQRDDYLDYEALVSSDDEFLCLSSIYGSDEADYDSMMECSLDSMIRDEVFYYASN